MKPFFFLCSLLLTFAVPLPIWAQVTITPHESYVSIDINGAPFTTLYKGKEAHKPFLFPLRTPSGKRVTRGYPVEPAAGDPTDHPHQRGLWVGAERLTASGIGPIDFWENDPTYKRPHMGVIKFKEITAHESGSSKGVLTFSADWISPGGDPVVTETRSLTFYSEAKDCRTFDIDLRLRADRDITFEDNDDTVIGIRLSPSFDQRNGGRPVNAQGLEGEANVRGRRSEWIDWQAIVDGEEVGVALMEHPANFSAPTRWHVRSIGLMIANPFGQHDYLPEAPVATNTLRAGQELHLRYCVLIHPKSTDVSQTFKEFAAR
jgi:Methane oxygenase PmoA